MDCVLASVSSSELIPLIAVGGGLLVAIVAISFGVLKSIMQTKAAETTKREIAAYVAEGSMTPEDAERIIKADMPSWTKGRKC